MPANALHLSADASPEHTRHYQPSGRVSPLVLPLLALALPASALLATVYSYVTLYLPIIGYFTVLLTLGLGFGVGAITVAALQRGKVRSRLFAVVASLGLGLFTTWAMWVTWGYALLQQGDSQVPLFVLLWPPALWQLISNVNETGAWSLKGATPTGAFLWVLWAIEAALLVGIPVVMGLTVAEAPYCEHCETWCAHQKAVLLTPLVEKDFAGERLRQRDFKWLESLGGLQRPPPPKFTRWDLYECGCRATNAVSAIGIEVGLDDKGNQKVTESTLVQTVLLGPDAVPGFRAIAQRLAPRD